MKKLQTAANIVFYAISLPIRITVLILVFPVILSMKDMTEKYGANGWSGLVEDVWDIVKYPHL